MRAESLTPEQVALVKSDQQPGAPRGPSSTFTIVGIVRRPLDLGDRAATGGVVVLTPAFDRLAAGRIGVFSDVLRVRTTGGRRDVPAVQATAEHVFGDSLFASADLESENDGAADAINVLSLALWLFAGVTAIAGAVAIAIILTREIAQTGVDQTTLQSLGMTRGVRTMVGAWVAGVVAVVGIGIAVGLALAISPLFPVGGAAPGRSRGRFSRRLRGDRHRRDLALRVHPHGWRRCRAPCQSGVGKRGRSPRSADARSCWSKRRAPVSLLRSPTACAWRSNRGRRSEPFRFARRTSAGLSASSALPRSLSSWRASPISRRRQSCTAGRSTSRPRTSPTRMPVTQRPTAVSPTSAA